MKLYLFMFCTVVALCVVSCTYNISMVHTQGESTDAVDSNAHPEVNPVITVPLSGSGTVPASAVNLEVTPQ